MEMPNMHKQSVDNYETYMFSPLIECCGYRQKQSSNPIKLETFILDDYEPLVPEKESDLMQIFQAHTQFRNQTPTSEKTEPIEEKYNNNVELKPFLMKDFEKPEIAFDYQKQTKKIQKNIWKITNNNNLEKNRKRKVYDKNICRYVARQIIRCFVSEDYESNVILLCNNEEKLYSDVTSYFLSRIEFITGHRALKDILIINEDDNEEVSEFKIIFRKFFKWFLKYRSLRYIILGNMVDKFSYIRFKNEIMLHYIDKPERWNSNKIEHQSSHKKIFSVKKEDDTYC